jgi:hypothetical protein
VTRRGISDKPSHKDTRTGCDLKQEVTHKLASGHISTMGTTATHHITCMMQTTNVPCPHVKPMISTIAQVY